MIREYATIPPLATPDFLVIGHITLDLTPNTETGYTLGGTATYSALTARALGLRAAILTRLGPQINPAPLLPEITLVALPSHTTTTFQNEYSRGRRRQYLRSIAPPITPSDVPDPFYHTPIVLLGPVAQEVDPQLYTLFPNALLGITPQGWMRTWQADGEVLPTLWTPTVDLLQRANVVVMSEEDLGGAIDLAEAYAAHTRILILTLGPRGARLYHQGQTYEIPAPPAQEIDPTGAGDIFTAAFMIHLHQHNDPWKAALFANCLAAHSVERPGLHGVPTADEIAHCRTGAE